MLITTMMLAVRTSWDLTDLGFQHERPGTRVSFICKCLDCLSSPAGQRHWPSYGYTVH